MADEEHVNKRSRENVELYELWIVLSIKGDDVNVLACGSFDFCLKRFKQAGYKESVVEASFEEWCERHADDIEDHVIYDMMYDHTILLNYIDDECIEKKKKKKKSF